MKVLSWTPSNGFRVPKAGIDLDCRRAKRNRFLDFRLEEDLDKTKTKILEPIGQHSFRVVENGEVERVSSRAGLEVDLLFLNAYRYHHDSGEVFRDGCLHEIRSATDDNGKSYRVEGSAAGNLLRIDCHDGTERVEGRLMTFA